MAGSNPHGVEDAWEDTAGAYHDEYAEVLEIAADGRMRLKFGRDDVTTFLDGCDYYATEYEPVRRMK